MAVRSGSVTSMSGRRPRFLRSKIGLAVVVVSSLLFAGASQVAQAAPKYPVAITVGPNVVSAGTPTVDISFRCPVNPMDSATMSATLTSKAFFQEVIRISFTGDGFFSQKIQLKKKPAAKSYEVRVRCFTQDGRATLTVKAVKTLTVRPYGYVENGSTNEVAYGNYRAGGIGTYENPITVSANTNFIKKGTRLYLAKFERYVVVEDECTDCGASEINIWVGGKKGATKNTAKEVKCLNGKLTMFNVRATVNPSKFPVHRTEPLRTQFCP